jgi:formylglycine-generating enzyme required for sulfatase activity
MNLDRIGWYCINSENKTHPVGQKEPNKWGLFDMSGNVFEWVDSQFNGQGSGTEPVTDPIGPTDRTVRILRGGSWYTYADHGRSARNFDMFPFWFSSIFGARLARTL